MSSSQFFASHCSSLLLASLLLIALATNIRQTEAKPNPAAATVVAGNGPVIEVPFQLEDGQQGELILEPVDELPPLGQAGTSLWAARAMNSKRANLGPRPLRFGRR